MLIVGIVSDFFLDILMDQIGRQPERDRETERDQTVCTFVNMINDHIETLLSTAMLTSTLDIDRRTHTQTHSHHRGFAFDFHFRLCVNAVLCIKLICRMTIQLLGQLIILAWCNQRFDSYYENLKKTMNKKAAALIDSDFLQRSNIINDGLCSVCDGKQHVFCLNTKH